MTEKCFNWSLCEFVVFWVCVQYKRNTLVYSDVSSMF